MSSFIWHKIEAFANEPYTSHLSLFLSLSLSDCLSVILVGCGLGGIRLYSDL